MVNLINKLEIEVVMSTKDAMSLVGSRSKLYRMVDTGEIRKVEPSGLGFFTLDKYSDEECHFIILSKYYPKCVVSGMTALRLYELGDDYFDLIDVDILNTTNLTTSIFNVNRVSKSQYTEIVEREFPDFGINRKIQIYSPERVLFEAYKYYGEGSDSFIRALKRYRSKYLDIKRPSTQYDQIMSINKKVGGIIIQVLKVGDVSE
ncbi:hypothetical protein A9Q84_14725 [Halobacteriovorax marinus]|uniref:Transcriptional regulator n=1 Tax=Halobacteriovorax marinus TaxID=97084 RepID=A0A1Y5FAH4_9BACT|nr:hypothetical protein A9Q84_14725 [Halobacteriovorax marinus]